MAFLRNVKPQDLDAPGSGGKQEEHGLWRGYPEGLFIYWPGYYSVQ
jgi:hypothetical protein